MYLETSQRIKVLSRTGRCMKHYTIFRSSDLMQGSEFYLGLLNRCREWMT